MQVRQALNYAVNRQAVTQAIYGKYGVPTDETGSLDGLVPSLQNYYSYNPAKAKSLLAAAGYPNGFTSRWTRRAPSAPWPTRCSRRSPRSTRRSASRSRSPRPPVLPTWVNQVLGGSYESAGFIATAFAPMSEWYSD